MRTRRTSSTPLHGVLSRLWSASIVGVIVSASVGCADIADLEAHKPFPGMPDSPSMKCSDGTKFVMCDSVRDTLPQDGNMLTTAPSYRLSGNDVVDEWTGLSWYTLTGPLKPHDEALAHCQFLGGYRLPTRIELVSLLDFSQDRSTRIDTNAFPHVEPVAYWTNSMYDKDVNFYWTVDFNRDSSDPYPVRSTYATNKAAVLCVKDDGASFVPGPFEAVGTGNLLLRDARTGLMWIKKPIRNSGTWTAALQDCPNAPHGSYGDFRTANAKELATLVDDAVAGQMTLGTWKEFEIEYNQTIWASTPRSKPDSIYVLNSTGGSIGQHDAVENSLWTMCVRGPD